MRRARRRSIGFVVGAEGLTVSVPRWVGVKEVDSALQEKRGWILRKLREQRERALRLQSARVDWRDGTGLPFLGDTVIIVLDPRATGAVLSNEADDAPAGRAAPAAARGPAAHRHARADPRRRAKLAAAPGAAGVRRTLRDLRHAPGRARDVASRSARPPTRWGSANADGSIRLNWRLIHFGLPIIDYVVAHELAHLREMNHSAAFWEVVRSVLPDYEDSRVALRDGQVPVFD